VIWFLRHGDAEHSEPDFDRRLTDKGRRQSRNAGLALAALGVHIDLCLSSPKVRARETAELACDALGAAVTLDERLAGGRLDPLDLTAGLDDVLLVGHEPDFSTAVADLTASRVKLRKGGIACVEEDLLHALLRPKELRRIAGM
jgi:phosphohistidine phosphatase